MLAHEHGAGSGGDIKTHVPPIIIKGLPDKKKKIWVPDPYLHFENKTVRKKCFRQF